MRKVVSELVREAACGRPAIVVALDSENAMAGVGVGTRLLARYQLCDELRRLVLHGRVNEKDGWEVIGSWPLHALVGVHRAEESALVRSARHEMDGLLSIQELERSAVFEFGAGDSATVAGANRTPLLLVEESQEHRERLVSGMQVLRIYRGARHRSESESRRRQCGREDMAPAAQPSSPAELREAPATPLRSAASSWSMRLGGRNAMPANPAHALPGHSLLAQVPQTPATRLSPSMQVSNATSDHYLPPDHLD